MRKILLLLLAVAAILTKSTAQEVGLKTNLAHWASASPNLGVEVGLGKQTTLDLWAGFNPFKFSHDRQWRHWIVQPEFRWWTCERFNGHFLGAHLLAGEFNVGNLSFFPFTMWDGLEDNRYKGHALGAGVTYGYAWLLGRHWNLEAQLGIGYAHAWYDQYNGAEYNDLVRSNGDKNYWGVTKFAISFVYLF